MNTRASLTQILGHLINYKLALALCYTSGYKPFSIHAPPYQKLSVKLEIL
jgi:hypothetical protein